MNATPRAGGPANRLAHGEGATGTDAAPDQASADKSPGDDAPRCGFVALIGAPNAGKSTLVNSLVGTKVSIVTHKVQTTRARLRGLVVEDNAQIVLIDTPGIFAPKRRLDRAMVQAAWAGAGDADICALIVDAAKGMSDEVESILEGLRRERLNAILVINKIDRVRRDQLLELIAKLNDEGLFSRTFLVSALNGDGVKDLKTFLKENIPLGPWHFPEDQLSDANMRFTAAEVTREKLYLRLHDELPYASTVETTSYKSLRSGGVRIEQTIFVERETQRRIVLGHKGATIKAIGSDAREELQSMLEMPVHLFLFVKVRERWGDTREHYEEMGLEFPDD